MNVVLIILVVLAGLAFVAFALKDRIRGRQVPDGLSPGRTLPRFEAVDENGERRSSRELEGAPAVLLFVRGTWCPFCSRQVENLTKHYKDITDTGARLVLITTQPLDTTRRVADMFGVDFEFWLDEGFDVVKELGLFLEGGIPTKHREEFGEDTIWPASLVTDASLTIRFSEVSRFIADRPDPQKLLGVVRQLT